MIINLDRKQKVLLLEILGMDHAIRHFKGEDNSDVAVLIEKMAASLEMSGEIDIFYSVFQEHRP